LGLYNLGTLFQFRGNHILLCRRIVFNAEKIGLTANLAIFHVGLSSSCGVIHRDLIPLAATRTLETGKHIIFRES
jgi:hypothetical protein